MNFTRKMNLNWSALLFGLLVGLAACTSTPVLRGAAGPQLERAPNSDYTLPPPVVNRARELSRYRDVATGNGYRSREALGAARLERHLQGRKVTPGKNTSVDWVDQKLGDISFKGPLVDDANYDGIVESLQGLSLEAVKNAIHRDLENNPTAPVLVIDTLGLTEGEVQSLETAVKADPNPYRKSVFILLEKEMKSLEQGRGSAGFDRFTNP